jgi:DNA-binding NtrC family response regulator
MEQVSEVAGVLDHARLLVVEDDFIISLELQSLLGAARATIVAPCYKISEALSALKANKVDAAVLDVRLGSHTAAPVADELVRRGIPFLFYTGQVDADPTRAAWPAAPIISKPAPSSQIVTAVAELLRR